MSGLCPSIKFGFILRGPNVDLKYCTRCEERKTLAEFNRHSKTKDRLQKWCRSCRATAYQQFKLNHPFRELFRSIKSRCECAGAGNYRLYGARGIQNKFASWEELAAELGPKPHPACSVDRINPAGHYEPGNVRWATNLEQQGNKGRRQEILNLVPLIKKLCRDGVSTRQISRLVMVTRPIIAKIISDIY